MKIEIEKKGWVYIILCFIITASAINTSNNSLFLLSSFMLSILVFSGILSTLNLYFLKIEKVEFEEIFAGRINYAYLIYKPKKIFPLSLMSNDQILKMSKGKIQYPLYYPKRGHYKFPVIRIESSFPFGFIKRTKLIYIDDNLIVYPACKSFDLPSFKVKKTDGEEEDRKKWGEILEFYGIKPFQEGDDPRHIHWKKTAQRGEIISKEFETKSRGNLQLFLDTHIKDEIQFEEEVEKVGSWCLKLLQEGKSVSLMTWDIFLSEGSGNAQRKKILSFLSVVKSNV